MSEADIAETSSAEKNPQTSWGIVISKLLVEKTHRMLKYVKPCLRSNPESGLFHIYMVMIEASDDHDIMQRVENKKIPSFPAGDDIHGSWALAGYAGVKTFLWLDSTSLV